MSTVIYNGFCIDISQSTNLRYIEYLAHDMRKYCQNEKRKKICRFIAKRVVDAYDRVCADPQINFTKNPVTDAWSELWDRQLTVKKLGYRDPEVDFESSFVILPELALRPIGKRFPPHALGIFYTEQPEWKRKFLRYSEVSDFAYWDNTDKPSNISVQNWNCRKVMWDDVLAQHGGIPAMNGFTFQLCDNSMITRPIDTVLKFQPSLESRARKLAKEYMLDQIFCNREDFKQKSTSEAVKIIIELNEFLTTTEGKQELENITESFKHDIDTRVSWKKLEEKLVRGGIV